MAEGIIPSEGKKIKDTKVKLGDGSEKKISELSGKKGLILYFYPKDNTSGCTQEACDFRDNFSALKKAGWNVVGVSPDSEKSHLSFTKKQSLNFSLISDENKKLCESLGLWIEKKLYGRSYMGVARTTIVLDSSLKVIRFYEKVKVKDHVKTVIKDIKDL